MRSRLSVLFVLSVNLFGSTAHADEAAVRRDLEQQYAAMRQAFHQRRFDLVREQVLPEYSASTPELRVKNRDQLQERLQKAATSMEAPFAWFGWPSRVQSITTQADTAVVTTEHSAHWLLLLRLGGPRRQRLTRDQLPPAQRVCVTVTVRDIWTRVPGSREWKLKASNWVSTLRKATAL